MRYGDLYPLLAGALFVFGLALSRVVWTAWSGSADRADAYRRNRWLNK